MLRLEMSNCIQHMELIATGSKVTNCITCALAKKCRILMFHNFQIRFNKNQIKAGTLHFFLFLFDFIEVAAQRVKSSLKQRVVNFKKCLKSNR